MIKIHDDLCPPIVTNASKGYIKLMQKCWNSDPNRRPIAASICKGLINIRRIEIKNQTEIIKSSDIGPIITSNSNMSDTISTRDSSSSEQGN